MSCGLLLVGFLATGAQAFRPAPIRWDGRLRKQLFLAPTLPLDGIITPQQLTLKDTLDSKVPYFTTNQDNTISCAHNDMRWCLEASGTERGHVVRVNHCTSRPTQKWRWLPWGSIQLEGTNQCVHVNENDGMNTASVELSECANKATDTWIFEDTALAPARSSLQSLSWPIFSIGAAVMVAGLGLGAWMWRWLKESGIVVASRGSVPLKMDKGGVCLTASIALRSNEITMKLSSAEDHESNDADETDMPDLSKWLTSQGLEQYCQELQDHSFQELHQMMSYDRDALYDILIDAGMKTGDRKMFLEALQNERILTSLASTSSSMPSLKHAKRSTVSYLLGPSFFQGPWSLERQIWPANGAPDIIAKCEGSATFTEEGYDQEVASGSETKKWLHYKESGDMKHASQLHTNPFSASYIYQHTIMQDRMHIFKDVARGSGPWNDDLLCTFNFSEAEFGVPLKSTSHQCGGDLYEGELIVSDSDAWVLRYIVTGPAKAMVIETKYRRMLSEPEKKVAVPFWF